MANAKKLARLSIDDYLRLEEVASIKHEFVDGEMFAMTGGTAAHSRIAVNILTILRDRLKGSGCGVYGSDFKVRVESTNSFYYPDASVDCSDYEGSRLFTTTPVIIFEVLSPSTAAIDRREKLVSYKRIPSLRAYVLVQQARRRVAVYLKDIDDEWTLQEITTGGDFEIEVCPKTLVKLSLDDIYLDTQIGEGPSFSVKEEEQAYVW